MEDHHRQLTRTRQRHHRCRCLQRRQTTSHFLATRRQERSKNTSTTSFSRFFWRKFHRCRCLKKHPSADNHLLLLQLPRSCWLSRLMTWSRKYLSCSLSFSLSLSLKQMYPLSLSLIMTMRAEKHISLSLYFSLSILTNANTTMLISLYFLDHILNPTLSLFLFTHTHSLSLSVLFGSFCISLNRSVASRISFIDAFSSS